MVTASRPVVLTLELVVRATWAVVDLLAELTVLVVEARRGLRRGASRAATARLDGEAAAGARTVLAVSRPVEGSWAA